MSNAIAKQDAGALVPLRYGFTGEQIEVIKATIAPNATDAELALFMMVCQKTGLDPFSRQIYLSERNSFDEKTQRWITKKTPETTIDGFRVVAERHGQYAGQEGPFWCGPDGVWLDVWLDEHPPRAAKVGILRHDFKATVWGTALFSEYVQTKKDGNPNRMWSKMAANQLAKCAESLGLRKAFPRDLSGMYTREEMGQAERNGVEAQQDVAQRRIAELRQIPAGSTISPQDIADVEPEQDTTPINYGSGKETATAVSGETRADHDSRGTIREIPPASTLGLSDYEQREAAKRAEAEEALEPPKRTATRKRGSIPFEALKHFGEIKKSMRALMGSDEDYYRVLKGAGYDHSDEIKDTEEARRIYKLLGMENNRMRADAELRNLLIESREQIGGARFLEILGVNGCEDIKMVMALDGAPLQALLLELKTEVDDRRKAQ